jgi:predicted Zn-dependent peptidase
MARKRSSTTRQIEREVLPNGVRVVTERMPHVRSVSVGLWIGTGSREEELHQTGLSHFVEHMVFKGTSIERRSKSRVRSIPSAGA